MPQLKVTATTEYEVNMAHYPDCTTLEEAAEIDKEGIIEILMYAVENGTLNVMIEPVGE